MAATTGATTNQLLKRFPNICLRFPLLVHKCVLTAAPSGAPTDTEPNIEPPKHDDIIKEYMKTGVDRNPYKH